MIVDVSWDGVKLAAGAQTREEAGGWFIELEQPMPVGTRLTLEGDAQATVRVTRVHEGLGAGMLVKAEGAVVSAAKPEAKAETNAALPSVVVADAASVTENGAAGDDKEPEDAANGTGGARRDRRKRKKPTA